MKLFNYVLVSLFMFFSASSIIQAQDQFVRGGLGYGSIGFSYGTITNLEEDLQASGLMCTYCSTPQFAWNIGGGGYGLFAKRLILAGSGYGLLYPVSESEETLVKTKGASGFFSIGYAVVNNNGWLIYPAFGIGYTAHTLKIENKTNGSLYFGDNKIHAGTQTEFWSGMPMLEIKIGLNKMLKDITRGPVLGLDIGYQFNVQEGEWKNTETGNIVGDINMTGYQGLFVTLTIGGGGFKME